eukprot:EG_transcript_25344
MSHGASETTRLKAQVREQLDRLFTQLEDCEEMKEDLRPEEYEQLKRETLAQLQEFQLSLQRMEAGSGPSLVSELGAVKLALQAACTDAFQTPEVLRLFASQQPHLLRSKLEEVKIQYTLKKLPANVYEQRSLEILSALESMGEPLSADEQHFVEANMTEAMKKFVAFKSDLDTASRRRVLTVAETTLAGPAATP